MKNVNDILKSADVNGDDAIKRKYPEKSKSDWDSLWTRCKSSINHVGKPSRVKAEAAKAAQVRRAQSK